MVMGTVLLKRTNISGNTPSTDILEYGELAMNYLKDNEKIFIKNDNNDVIDFIPRKEIENMINEAITLTLNTPI